MKHIVFLNGDTILDPRTETLKVLKELKPTTPIIALTATATKEVLRDISNSLEIKDAIFLKNRFTENNLAYQIFTLKIN